MSTPSASASPSTTTIEQLNKGLTTALDAGMSHSDIIVHLRQLVLDRAKNAPPIKVLFNNSYGGFGVSESFADYLTVNGLSFDLEYGAKRDKVELIAAITEFGRQACERLPFVAEDWHVSKFYPLGCYFFDVEQEMSFEEYAKANPDRWMFHRAVPDCHIQPLLAAHKYLAQGESWQTPRRPRSH